jgi:hypothetical protein
VRSPHRLLSGALLATLLCVAPPLSHPAVAQQAQSAAAAATNPLSLDGVRTLLARGDAAAAAGRLTEARGFYDQARDLCLSGSFRGLDARIPREMDQKGRETLTLLSQANLRLAAVFRRLNQPEVAVPLLVEVVKVMTPTSEEGRKAYQGLVEIGFVATPYTAGQAAQ